MTNDYECINFQNLASIDYFKLSTHDYLMLGKTVSKVESSRLLIEMNHLQHRFLALAVLSQVDQHFCLKEGPSSFAFSSPENKLFFESKSYFYISPDRFLYNFWIENFLFIGRNFLKTGVVFDQLSRDIVNRFGTSNFFESHILSTDAVEISPSEFITFSLALKISDKAKTRILKPVLPPYKQRLSFNGLSRPEPLWSEADFYSQHESLVHSVWDRLDPSEQAAFVKAKKKC